MKTGEEHSTSLAEDLSRWVEKKPLIVMKFGAGFSESLDNSKQGLKRFTFAQSHRAFDNFKLPTLCLVEMQRHESSSCYVGVVKQKKAVTTFDSRISVIKLQQIIPSSLKEVNKRITEKRFSNVFSSKLSQDHITSVLSPKLSAHIVRLLSSERSNQNALDTVIAQLTGFRSVSNINWAQDNAIQTAMVAFGLGKTAIPSMVTVKSGTSSILNNFIGANIIEEDVIYHDASNIPGFSLIEKHLTGLGVCRT